MHYSSSSILHLISTQRHPVQTQQAKLLDFGLSKAIDADTGGSVARTFVGTPSYLAPEVEEKQGGRGKPYGTPVDCWSLGAMLYVMLVARFPEFQVQVCMGAVGVYYEHAARPCRCVEEASMSGWAGVVFVAVTCVLTTLFFC